MVIVGWDLTCFGTWKELSHVKSSERGPKVEDCSCEDHPVKYGVRAEPDVKLLWDEALWKLEGVKNASEGVEEPSMTPWPIDERVDEALI